MKWWYHGNGDNQGTKHGPHVRTSEERLNKNEVKSGLESYPDLSNINTPHLGS